MQSVRDREDIALSEFILVEFYRLLRNPAVSRSPLDGKQACDVINGYRSRPYWKILGFPPHSRDIHDQLFESMSDKGIAYRRIYDTRTALTLKALGVTEFATANVKDFPCYDFHRVWNPLT